MYIAEKGNPIKKHRGLIFILNPVCIIAPIANDSVMNITMNAIKINESRFMMYKFIL